MPDAMGRETFARSSQEKVSDGTCAGSSAWTPEQHAEAKEGATVGEHGQSWSDWSGGSWKGNRWHRTGHQAWDYERPVWDQWASAVEHGDDGEH
eukprot:5945733-Karenia_brevis.AAC.1